MYKNFMGFTVLIASVAAVLSSGCIPKPQLLKGEAVISVGSYDRSNGTTTDYKMTDSAIRGLMAVTGILQGDVYVNCSDGDFSGAFIGNEIGSPEFYNAYTFADADGNGIVDTSEVESAIDRAVRQHCDQKSK